MIGTGKRNKTLSEVRPVENISKNLESFLEIRISSYQRRVFCKFKKEKFIKLLKEFKICKTVIIFKTNIVKLINNYPKLMKSTVTLKNFFKNYFKDIKEMCSENSNKFK